MVLENLRREIYGKVRKRTRFQLQIEAECYPSKGEGVYSMAEKV
jgi:hypothetical protein